MKLFVGLGNPGKEYSKNRHNIGYMFLRYLVNKMSPGTLFTLNPRFSAETAEVTNNGDKYIFAEPQTYMNRSGESVVKLVQFYKIKPEDIYVVHDDLDIPLGKFKIQNGTGPKLHGGLSSIEQLFGTPDFWRIRVGVENRNPETYLPGEAYVLQNFTEAERVSLFSIFEKIHNQLQLSKIL